MPSDPHMTTDSAPTIDIRKPLARRTPGVASAGLRRVVKGSTTFIAGTADAISVGVSKLGEGFDSPEAFKLGLQNPILRSTAEALSAALTRASAVVQQSYEEMARPIAGEAVRDAGSLSDEDVERIARSVSARMSPPG